ncbi:MAG: hypothetical protein LUD79_00660 [Oscillospiraceae bacterium]|nr:hypothetical protein [Oscillospiraceae bacterium]
MPQTREHLDILKLLHIPSGVVALTKCDLVSRERLEQVREELALLLRGSFLEGAVSTGTLTDGEIAVGDTVMIYPQQRSARVRALQTYGVPRESVCRLRLLDADTLFVGQSGCAQLKLSRPMVVRNQDRFILQFFSPMVTVNLLTKSLKCPKR